MNGERRDPGVAAQSPPTERAARPGAVHWWKARDPDLLVAKRSVRAAVVMPCVFAITHGLFSDAQVALFAAFGSFALLLLVEFTGPVRTRVLSYAALALVGGCLVVLGTVVSTDEVAAVVTMGVVGLVVLFAGIVAPQAATASTAALLTFVLPVSIARPVSDVGPRLLGWAVAVVSAVAACLLVWPPPWHDDLRRRLAASISVLARLVRLRASPDGRVAGADGTAQTGQLAQEALDEELERLRMQFSATPYPPTGAVSGAVALSKLVGRVEWVAGNTALIGRGGWGSAPSPARVLAESAADTLDCAAVLICDEDGHPVRSGDRVDAVRASAERLDRLIDADLDADVAAVGSGRRAEIGGDGGTGEHEGIGEAEHETLAGSLDAGFRARALGIATGLVADGALEAAGAPGLLERRLGAGRESTGTLFRHRLTSHLSLRSVWFRNALRGAIGLALAVAVVEVTDVQHGFWVVLGTMSVLRSNALGTGATALQAVGGTALGFVLGAAIMVGVADHTVLLWALLPLAVLISGVAPSMISFVAGQAAFTLMVIILFNIIEPVGWKVGLTRIEDVAIGCGVSVVVGFLFWPRGATAALGRALATAFVASSGYLSDAVERLTSTSRHVDTEAGQRRSHHAYLLLDDAYRQFFAERGAKVVPLETVSGLFTGSNRLRLAAFTLASLPVRPPDAGVPEVESIVVAEAVLRDAYASAHAWYEEFAQLLADRRDSLGPPIPHGATLHHVLRNALDDVRGEHRADRVRTALQMLWTEELLEEQARMQQHLLDSAGLFVRARRGVSLI